VPIRDLGDEELGVAGDPVLSECFGNQELPIAPQCRHGIDGERIRVVRVIEEALDRMVTPPR